MQVLRRLWKDEAGFVVSSELVLIGTLLVLGLIVGLTEVRNQVVQELADLGVAIGRINQSYTYSGVTGHGAATAGSSYQDANDYCDNNGVNTAGQPPAGITFPSNVGDENQHPTGNQMQ